MMFNRQIFLFVSLLSNVVFAQTDSLRYDKWIGWFTPLSIYHKYHSAIEIGTEYNPKNQMAYTFSYGLKISDNRTHFFNQEHQYIRLGVKKYLGRKQTAGYVMGELGLFHISHDGSNVYWGHEKDPEIRYAKARFHDFLVKHGAIFGSKIRVGELRFDFFSGFGLRLGSRRYHILEISDRVPIHHSGEYDQNYNVSNSDYHTRPRGWKSIKPYPYMSFGFRFGIGFKTITAPPQ